MSRLLRLQRTVPLRLLPVEGESFSSFVQRHAADLEVSLFDYYEATGLTLGWQSDRRRRLPPGFGVGFSPARLPTFAYVTGLLPAQIEDTLLSRYEGIALQLTPVDFDDRFALCRRYLRCWAFFAGSHLCPKCLAEHRAWQLVWKFPWSFACVRHQCLLIDMCPQCERQMGWGSSDMGMVPACGNRVPRPGFCANSRPMRRAGRTWHKAGPGTCGQDLTQLQAVSLIDWSDLMQAQRVIDQALEGRGGTVAGERVSSLEYFRDLRATCALLLFGGSVELFGSLPDAARRAVAAYAKTRDDKTRTRRELAIRGRAGTQGLSSTYYSRTPRNAALMAAVLPKAIQYLSSPSLHALRDQFAPLMATLSRQHNSALGTWLKFKFSPRVTDVLRDRRRTVVQFSRRVGFHAHLRVESRRFYRYSPCHVPQLLWHDVSERHFQELFHPRTAPDTVRRFCSIALVKACGRYSWAQAATALEFPPTRYPHHMIAALRKRGQTDIFAQRFHETAQWLEATPGKVDYAARRRVLRTFRSIPWQQWRTLCERARLDPGRRNGRSRYAAAWLWCSLGGGDPSLAPALQGEKAAHLRIVYARFLRRELAQYRGAALAYGEKLLRAAGVS